MLVIDKNLVGKTLCFSYEKPSGDIKFYTLHVKEIKRGPSGVLLHGTTLEGIRNFTVNRISNLKIRVR